MNLASVPQTQWENTPKIQWAATLLRESSGYCIDIGFLSGLLLAKGYSNKEIASKLSLTFETIQSYLKSVYRKMHVHSRAEAAAKYRASRSE